MKILRISPAIVAILSVLSITILSCDLTGSGGEDDSDTVSNIVEGGDTLQLQGTIENTYTPGTGVSEFSHVSGVD